MIGPWARAGGAPPRRSPSSSGGSARARSATACERSTAATLAAAAAIGAADHRLLCLAVDDRGPRARRPPVAARGRRRVLPVDVPQPDAARRRRRRRPPRRQPRPRRARRRPRPAGRGMGAGVRAARPGRAHRRRPARAAVAGAPWMPLVGGGAGCGGGRRRAGRPGAARRRASRLARLRSGRRAATSATGCWRRRALPAIALASVLVVLGHAATFVIAARAAGATAPASRMLPLALLALLAMCCPASPAGGRGRARRRGCSGRPGWVRARASRPPSCTA